MWVIFLVWVAFIFVVPCQFGTDLYNEYVAATSGTIFGETGSAFLVYSGPLFVIAFLAVAYLLISGGQELPEKNTGKYPSFRLRTFPVFVDGPFGVVSAAELIGIFVFVVFVLWATYAYTMVNFRILETMSMSTGEKRVYMLRMSAYIFGLIALSCFIFLFLPIARGSVLLRLIDVPFEHATRYHIWLGHLVMFLLTLHGVFYMIEWLIDGIFLEDLVEWKSNGGANFAGVLCYSVGLLMWVTSLPPVRKKNFELFYYTHQLYVVFIILMALHMGAVNFSEASGGIFLYMLDRFLRFIQSKKVVNIISASCFPCGTIKLVLSKPPKLRYIALSFIFIRIRELSWLEWHPFSVSSSPLDGNYHISVLIKAVGGWTTKLRSYILSNSGKEPFEPHSKITASVEGPYGHESPYHLMYENLVLVAGGSGISPFLAIMSDLLHRIRDGKPCVPKNVVLVWSVKRSKELSLLTTVDMESICPFFSQKLNLEIQTYVTQELESPLEEDKIQNATISSAFPAFHGRSMSVLVGTGNKIWSGLYVIIPSIGLVICVGLLDIFYINPYSVSYWWYLGLLFVFCMVATVLVFGGFVAGLWYVLEERNSDTNDSGEDGNYINVSRLKEPVPYKELLCQENIDIQYGRRPCFKELFGSVSERWGNVDVGVIVCGPQTLESSVAKECRTHNLRRSRGHPIFHFNSHSFSL